MAADAIVCVKCSVSRDAHKMCGCSSCYKLPLCKTTCVQWVGDDTRVACCSDACAEKMRAQMPFKRCLWVYGKSWYGDRWSGSACEGTITYTNPIGPRLPTQAYLDEAWERRDMYRVIASRRYLTHRRDEGVVQLLGS